MAFNGSGSFVRLYNWVQDRINGIKIRADRMDAEMDGMATGLSNTICRDGQSTTTAAIPFAQGIQTDEIDEESAGAGVTIDSVLLKDGRVDWSKASDVASAGTTSIGAIDGNYVVITGTTTITSFGTGTAGMTRIVRFSGALTLTHNGTSLILATGADRTTAAGDEAIFVCEGTTNWREVFYGPAGGLAGLTKDNTLSGSNTFSGSLTRIDTTADATAGPFFISHRNSASPAANDLLGGLQIDGEDDAGNQQTYADILAEILDPGSGSEDARIWLRSVVAGTLANRLAIGQGVWTPNATGGDQGADTINASGFYVDGSGVLGPFLHVRDEKSSTTDGGTFTSGAWRTRDLNTVVTNQISGASLSSNQITLPAGTYLCIASAPAQAVNRHQTRLYNVTDTAVIEVGTSSYTNTADIVQTRSEVRARFILAASKVIELQHQANVTKATDGFGVANDFTTEIYSDVMIWKVG